MRTKKARDVQKRLETEGWVWIGGAGGHRVFVHPVRPGKIVLSWHHNGQATVSPGVFGEVVNKAGWKR